MCGATSHVRFTPDSDRESGFPQTVMSALPPPKSARRTPRVTEASSKPSVATPQHHHTKKHRHKKHHADERIQ
jgi:hypothetical protein